jgi:hypothetical protein
MGYDMYHRVGIHYTPAAINTAILGWYPTLGHYCDVLYYPNKAGKCARGRVW